ncbi:MAG: hypothetical protein JXB48_09200 [Candidatus Latescibacteria bacterium]|nr:hypothetical protein [Candidatus Latescibacterota bacterium]
MKMYKIYLLFIFLSFLPVVSSLSAQNRDFTEEQRKIWNQEYDKMGLLHSSGMVVDTSESFIHIPDDMNLEWMGDVDIAETAPTIDFAPIRGMKPEYFPEDNYGYWSDFGDVTLAPNGRYYFAVGDHRGRDGKSYAFEYDPVGNNCTMIINFPELCGWNVRGVGDGKIHGEMGAMPDGNLWILTYWDPMPWSTEEDYNTWPGSNLVRYNTFTGKAENLGIPMPKSGWPYYTLDTERGKLVAVGFRGEILCYDVNEERVTYAGYPPTGVNWWVRCTMLDPATGIFWSCLPKPPHNFVSFDPATNVFTRYDERTPEDLGRNAGKNSVIRAHSERRTREGFLWVNSTNGTLYKFWPDDLRTEVVTQLWADYTYSPRVSLSPDERYLYYVANTKRSDYRYKPIVQFDTVTKRRKVLAFIADYYFEKYGYVFGSMHGSTLSHDGKTFVMVFNGSFLPRDSEWQDTPSLVVLHIPENER